MPTPGNQHLLSIPEVLQLLGQKEVDLVLARREAAQYKRELDEARAKLASLEKAGSTGG